MAATLREETRALFKVTSDEKPLEEIISICQIYNLSPESLLYKWEAINFNAASTHSEMPPFSMDSVATLKAHLQRELANESSKKAQRAMPPGSAAVVNRSRIPANMARVMNTGAKVGVIQVKEEQSGASSSKVVFRGPKMDASSRKDRAYRYMYEKISERSEALDDRIDEFGELVRQHYKISELGDPSSSTDEEITVVGRITCDSDSSSQLTEGNIMIESSRMLSSGTRVQLRFDPSIKIRGGVQGAGSVGLFPGTMVALRGKNGGGGWFLVNEILVMPPLRAPSSDQPKLKVNPAVSDEPFFVYVACGPYTLDADLSYKPWHAFLKILKTSKPTVVLLAGPFIDVAHPKIKSGDVDTTTSNLFHKQFLEPLRNFLDSSPGSIVLILPSVRDLISRQAVFPQGELDPEFRVDPRIHLLPNPALFSLNDIKFAISSVDVLFHLRKEEFLKRGEEVDSVPPSSTNDSGSDSMSNACRHLLQQRSFYPIFPAPLDVSHEVNLSVTHWDGLKLSDDNDAPDVLIVPSRLKQFSKIVCSTTAVNPSFLTKGTYAVINISGDPEAKLKDRLHTEIAKIER